METTLFCKAKTAALQLIFLFALTVPVQAQTWLWGKNYGSIPDDYLAGQKICTDGSGNVIIAGNYIGATIAFGSNTLVNSSAQPNLNADTYVVKHDASGNVLWSKSFGCNDSEVLYGLCVDAGNNIFISGTFFGNSMSGTGMVLGTYTLNYMGGNGDMFLAKLDANGNVLWVKTAGGYNLEEGRSLCTDAAGNVYLAGGFYSQNCSVDGNVLTNNGYIGSSDFFIAKYDPAGNVLWVQQGGGPYDDILNTIATDLSGNIIAAGKFLAPSMTLGAVTLTNTVSGGNSADAFIAKYDASGNALWATTLKGIGDEAIQSLCVDSGDNILVTGNFRSAVLSCGTVTLGNTGSGSYDAFVAKYNSAGAFQWTKKLGGSSNDFAYSICVDSGGSSYVTGGYYSSSFIIGSLLFNNSQGGSSDIFVCSYDPSGNFVGALSANGNQGEFGNGICWGGGSDIYIAGYFRSSNVNNTLNLGNIALLNNSNAMNVFVAKMTKTSLFTGIKENVSSDDFFSIFPNPAQNNCTVKITTNEPSGLKLYTAGGVVVRQAELSAQNNDWTIDTSTLPDGLYLVQLITTNQLYNGKLVVHH